MNIEALYFIVKGFCIIIERNIWRDIFERENEYNQRIHHARNDG